MKIIILSAGKGHRLMPLTRQTPKVLLDVGNGKTLLEEQVSRIKDSAAISEIVLVVGYLAEMVDAEVEKLRSVGIPIRVIYNPFFDESNNFISLWLARNEMNSDFMITNGDNIFSPEVFSSLAQVEKDGIYLSVIHKDKFDDDDMKVAVIDGRVAKVSKLLEAGQSNAESPGLVLVRGKSSCQSFLSCVDSLVRRNDSKDVFWLEAFNYLNDRGGVVTPWYFQDGWVWQEVDFHLDIEKARNLLRIRQ